MQSGRVSRAARSPHSRASGLGDNWADKSFKMAELTYTPYSPRPAQRRPFTAPAKLNIDDIDNLVSRLSRPNTSTARKAVLWSKPRKEYEFNYDMTSNLKNPHLYWTRFPQLSKHYPGTWRVAKTGELQNIVSRLVKTTVASNARKDDCVSRRLLVEREKSANINADIGFRQKQREEDKKKPQDALNSPTSHPEGEKTGNMQDEALRSRSFIGSTCIEEE